MMPLAEKLAASMSKLTFIAAIVALAVFAGETLACPTCKDGIAESDPAARQMAAGYFYSILFMMSMPFAILGTFGIAAYRSVRRAQADQAALDGASDDAAE